ASLVPGQIAAVVVGRRCRAGNARDLVLLVVAAGLRRQGVGRQAVPIAECVVVPVLRPAFRPGKPVLGAVQRPAIHAGEWVEPVVGIEFAAGSIDRVLGGDTIGIAVVAVPAALQISG